MGLHRVTSIILCAVGVLAFACTSSLAANCTLRFQMHGSSVNATQDAWKLETADGPVAGFEVGKMFTKKATKTTITTEVEIDDSLPYFLRLMQGAKRPWMGGNLQLVSDCGEVLLSITKTNSKPEEIRNLNITCPTRLCHPCAYQATIPVTEAPSLQEWHMFSANNTMIAEREAGYYTSVKKATKVDLPVRHGQSYTITLGGVWTYQAIAIRNQDNQPVKATALTDALTTTSLNGCRCLTKCAPLKKTDTLTFCTLADDDTCPGAKKAPQFLWDYCTEVPGGSFTYQGAEYLFFNKPSTFDDAISKCETMGAELATFHDYDTMQAVWVQYHKDAGPFTTDKTPFVWIGTVRNGTRYSGYYNLDDSHFDFSAFDSPEAFCTDCPATSAVAVLMGGFPTHPTWVERPVRPIHPKMSPKSLMFPPLCRRIRGQTFSVSCPIPAPAPTEDSAAAAPDTTGLAGLGLGGLTGLNLSLSGGNSLLPLIGSNDPLLGSTSSMGKTASSASNSTSNSSSLTSTRSSKGSAGTMALVIFGVVGGAAAILIIVMGGWSIYRGVPMSRVVQDWRQTCSCCACCRPKASSPKEIFLKSKDFAVSVTRKLSFRRHPHDENTPTSQHSQLQAIMIDRRQPYSDSVSTTSTMKTTSTTTGARKEVNWSPGVVTAEYIFDESNGTPPHGQSTPPLRHPFRSPVHPNPESVPLVALNPNTNNRLHAPSPPPPPSRTSSHNQALPPPSIAANPPPAPISTNSKPAPFVFGGAAAAAATNTTSAKSARTRSRTPPPATRPPASPRPARPSASKSSRPTTPPSRSSQPPPPLSVPLPTSTRSLPTPTGTTPTGITPTNGTTSPWSRTRNSPSPATQSAGAARKSGGSDQMEWSTSLL